MLRKKLNSGPEFKNLSEHIGSGKKTGQIDFGIKLSPSPRPIFYNFRFSGEKGIFLRVTSIT